MRRVREQCGAQRSTEAKAQPAARRPCPHKRKRSVGKGTPKKIIKYLPTNSTAQQ
ncbi:MAG: hypothetical protein NZ455_12060 [Bacteroidia bacterium]|nr:hypothetical protein [Bacteroidia bacterium]MDW8346637.1 hypothetical protein [Bacteroidia bacterium]